MLCRLAISNIAVIDKAEITLEEGFTALTGETGAGKSLIMDAITMVLGGRTGRDLIRGGRKSASCEAAFFCKHPLADETGMLVLRREIYADGRNLCSINGNMVTVASLREAGASLLSMHGQHDTEQLLHKESHLSFVDAFAKAMPKREAFSTLYEEKKQIEAEIEELNRLEGEKSRRLEMLRFWIDEIEAAAPIEGEDERLEEKRENLRHSEQIRQSALMAYAALCGDEGAARDAISTAVRALERAGKHDKRLEKAAETLRDTLYQMEEAAGTVLDISEEETDAADLEMTEERLDVLQKLKRKYGGTLSEVLKYAEDARAERDKIEMAAETCVQLTAKLEKTKAALSEAADALSACRRAAAEKIEKATEKELSALDMEKVRFFVRIQPKDYSITGADEVEFFISTNPAEQPKPLAKIASGGELSRICMALQTVIAEAADMAPDVMIFDEIDTGISGRAAQKTGEKLRMLAKKRQVICVTHLPQIAAKADAQFQIEKREAGGGFSTVVTPLTREGRIEEIARMISGDGVTDKTRVTAEEMLR